MEKPHSFVVNELTLLSGGLLSGDDIISLPDSIRLKGIHMIDRSNDARHVLGVEAKKAIKILQRPHRFDAWVTYAVWTAGLHKDQVAELISFLNSVVGLDIKKGIHSYLLYCYTKVVVGLQGGRTNSLAFRTSPTVQGLLLAILRAMSPVLAVVLLVSILQYGANFALSAIVAPNILFILLVVITTIAHEYVHIIIAKHAKNSPVVVQRGLRIGVLHGSVPRNYLVLSSLLGPLAGAVVSIALLGIFTSAVRVAYSSVIAISVAIFHLMSWLPGYGDGATLKKIIQERIYA